MKKNVLSLLLTLVMLLGLAACGEDTPAATDPAATQPAATEPAATQPEENVQPGSWAIYWYLCGSDLETNNGCASMDLQEMLEVSLPENVNVVIQTGGANVWQNEFVDPSKQQRWLYSSEGLQLLEEQDTANMGDAQTLYEFLHFANTNFPAEKVAVTFWNHGGGSVSGAAFDEQFGLDSLNLVEMYQAFDAVWPANTDAPALEVVGFDTCLMATVDVAATFRPFANYLVASEEVEPGNGWLYSGWIGALAEDPSMDGLALGKAICDSFYAGCEAVGTHEQVTLSVTDLSRLQPLLDAYEALGQEALAAAAEDPAFFATLARIAVKSENYGGNTRDQGYTNMVDLGHLARQTEGMLPSSQAVGDALAECVRYRVGGVYRSEATGLSCYYSYNGDVDDFNNFAVVGASQSFKHLYAYNLTGSLAEGGQEYLQSLQIPELPEIVNLTALDWDGAPLDINEDGAAVLTLGEQAQDVLAGIRFSLYYVDEENDQKIWMGTDNDIIADWENGIFTENFRGVWGSLDEHLVFMELSYEGEGYNLYSVPILLNDELYSLQVVYDFTTEQWQILGAAPALDESGMAAKELVQIQEGDSVAVIWKIASASGEEDYQEFLAAEWYAWEETTFSEIPLVDSHYAMVFEMWDACGNFAQSDYVTFDIIEGQIITTVYED